MHVGFRYECGHAKSLDRSLKGNKASVSGAKGSFLCQDNFWRGGRGVKGHTVTACSGVSMPTDRSGGKPSHDLYRSNAKMIKKEKGGVKRLYTLSTYQQSMCECER